MEQTMDDGLMKWGKRWTLSQLWCFISASLVSYSTELKENLGFHPQSERRWLDSSPISLFFRLLCFCLLPHHTLPTPNFSHLIILLNVNGSFSNLSFFSSGFYLGFDGLVNEGFVVRDGSTLGKMKGYSSCAKESIWLHVKYCPV